jgi:hypothetical protein
MIGLRLGLGLRARIGPPPVIPPPLNDYLTDSTGSTLTDSTGSPLWASAAHDFLTDSTGQTLSDSTGSQLWS